MVLKKSLAAAELKGRGHARCRPGRIARCSRAEIRGEHPDVEAFEREVPVP